MQQGPFEECLSQRLAPGEEIMSIAHDGGSRMIVGMRSGNIHCFDLEAGRIHRIVGVFSVKLPNVAPACVAIQEDGAGNIHVFGMHDGQK